MVDIKDFSMKKIQKNSLPTGKNYTFMKKLWEDIGMEKVLWRGAMQVKK